MSIQLIVDGNDLSGYVVSSDRNHCLCNPIGTLTLQMAPDLPFDILPYHTIEFCEQGTRVFTGYASEFKKARMPIEVTLNCSDELIRAKDSWLTSNEISNGESVAYWVDKFLSLAGITDKELSPGCSQGVYPGFGWQYGTAMASIMQTLQMSPYQIYADRNGKVHLTEMRRGVPLGIITEYTNFERTRNDSWIRNRAVVMGYGDNVADQARANPLIPGEIRTVVVATGAIYNSCTANAIAEAMLDEFENPLDVKVLTVPGDPKYEIGQTYRITDSWSGYNETCLISSVTSSYSAHTYQTELTFDEKCPRFWGWDRPPLEYLTFYCGTWGRGVWKSVTNGETWSPTTLGNKYVYDIHLVDSIIFEAGTLWAACKEGVYKTTDGGLIWNKESMGNPSGWDGEGTITESDLYWVSVLTKNYDPEYIYALAGEPGNRAMWVYIRPGFGESWESVRVR